MPGSKHCPRAAKRPQGRRSSAGIAPQSPRPWSRSQRSFAARTPKSRRPQLLSNLLPAPSALHDLVPAAISPKLAAVGHQPESSFRQRENSVINLGGRVFQARPDVSGFQVREILQNRLLAFPGRQHVEHILDANAHPADARPPTALVRVEGDSVQLAHIPTLRRATAAASPPVRPARRSLLAHLYVFTGPQPRCRRAGLRPARTRQPTHLKGGRPGGNPPTCSSPRTCRLAVRTRSLCRRKGQRGHGRNPGRSSLFPWEKTKPPRTSPGDGQESTRIPD